MIALYVSRQIQQKSVLNLELIKLKIDFKISKKAVFKINTAFEADK